MDAPGLVALITSKVPLQLDIWVAPHVMVGETTSTSLNESKLLPSARRTEFSLKESTTNVITYVSRPTDSAPLRFLPVL